VICNVGLFILGFREDAYKVQGLGFKVSSCLGRFRPLRLNQLNVFKLNPKP